MKTAIRLQRRCTSLSAVLALLLACDRASAYIMMMNQRLDRAIYSKHDPKLIVAGEITKRDVRKRPPRIGTYPADVSFRFLVKTVVLGDKKYNDETLTIPATSFMWPTGLLAFEEGVRCALVLRTDWGEKNDGLYLCSVVPLCETDLPAAKDGEEAKAILASQLVTLLKSIQSPQRQRHLILQVAPVLPQEKSGVFVPFLRSSDIWLRRAALAGLVYTTREQKYMDMAQKDIEHFIDTTGSARTIVGPDGRDGYGPLSLLFDHYFLLSTFWSSEEAEAGKAFLQLFRMLAHSDKLPERLRWTHGVRPLCRIGTRLDAKFLYQYCQHRDTQVKREILRLPSNRQEIIMGISRIFDLGLSSWVESEFLKKEQEQHRRITDALVEEGIIDQRDAHRHPEQGATADANMPRR